MDPLFKVGEVMFLGISPPVRRMSSTSKSVTTGTSMLGTESKLMYVFFPTFLLFLLFLFFTFSPRISSVSFPRNVSLFLDWTRGVTWVTSDWCLAGDWVLTGQRILTRQCSLMAVHLVVATSSFGGRHRRRRTGDLLPYLHSVFWILGTVFEKSKNWENIERVNINREKNNE